MKNMKYRASVALIWWLAPIGSSQPLATAQGPLVDARPLAEASLRLQENSGRIVTYEEPVLTWSGDLEEIPGRSGSKGYLYPKAQAFWMPEPASAPDLAAALNKVLDNYHQQTSGTRFQILTSKWGYHIVPRQVHDANGALVASASLLDSRITIAQNLRTPEGHLAAFATAVAAVTSTRLEVSAIPFKPRGFDEAFRARPERFSWGAEPTTARDVLIDLLSRSATSFSWRLRCQASLQSDARFCVLDLAPIAVAITNGRGQPDKAVLWFDRCGDCPPLRQVQPPSAR